jgi:hypothetical protein
MPRARPVANRLVIALDFGRVEGGAQRESGGDARVDRECLQAAMTGWGPHRGLWGQGSDDQRQGDGQCRSKLIF